MKVSVSLPAEDVEFLDDYARRQGLASRSAVMHKAVRTLKAAGLSEAYEVAWDEWAATGEAEPWESTTADGLA